MIWLTLVGIVALAVVVALAVGLAVRGAYRNPVWAWCPYARRKVAVRVGRAGLAEALGLSALRRVDECALRQDRWLCRDACLTSLQEPSRVRA